MAIDATSIDSSAAQRTAPRERTSPIINDGHMGGGVEIRGEMSFWDFLDVINPLQHIPIVNTIYRNLTGDTIQPSSRVIGGILYGGPLGGMTAIANAVVEEAKGQDFGDQIMSSLGFGGDAHPTEPVAVAAAPGGPATAGSPAEPQPAQAASTTAAGQPLKLGAPTGAAAAAAGTGTATPSLAAQLAAGSAHGAFSPPGKMPARDTPLASSTMAKHAVPKFAAPLPGSVPVGAQGSAQVNAQIQAQAAGQASAGPSSNGPAANANAAPPANGNAAGAAPAVTPDTLSETMMRNLAKYEQSRKAAQSAAPTLKVSG